MAYKVTLRCSLDLPRVPSGFADVELVVQDGPEPCAIPVDRIILLAACPMFQKILGMMPFDPDHFDCNCFRPRVYLDGVKPDALRAFVDLVYQGVCDVNKVAYDGVMLVCNLLGFKKKDRLVREVRAPPEEEEEVMIIEDEEQVSNGNGCGETGGGRGPQSLGIQNDFSVDVDVGEQSERATSTPLHKAPNQAVAVLGNSSSISSRSGFLGGLGNLGEGFQQNQLGVDGINDDENMENTTSGRMDAPSVHQADFGSVSMVLCESLRESYEGSPLPVSLGSGAVPSSRPSSEASDSRNVTDHHLKSSKGRNGEDISNQTILKEMQCVGRQGDILQQRKVSQRKKASNERYVLWKKDQPRQGGVKSIAVAAGASQECKLCGEDASEGFSLGRERVCKHCFRTKPSACHECRGCSIKKGCAAMKQWTMIRSMLMKSNKSASSGPSMKNYGGENIKKIGGGAMVSAPPSSGSTDKPLPRRMLRSGGKEGKENVVSEKNNNKPVGSKKKKKRSLSTQPRSRALQGMSKRYRPQRPGGELYSDQKKFQCLDCDQSFLTESAFRRHMKNHYMALRDDDMHSIV